MEHFGHKLACQSQMLVFKGPDLFLVAVICKEIKKKIKPASRIKGVGLRKQPFQNFGDFPISELIFYNFVRHNQRLPSISLNLDDMIF